MSFPRSFYQQGSQPRLVRTAACTGRLSSPFDLVNYSQRPWVTVEMAFSNENPKEKVLIFADSFYMSRSDENKNEIMDRLRSAKSLGFKILILEENGELKEWDGEDLPADYHVDPKTYSNEIINQLAWQQHQLSASNIFILDYWGINELNESERGEMEWSLAAKQNDDLISILNTADEESVFIDFSNESQESFKACIDLLVNNSLIKKIKGFDLSGIELSKENLEYILQKASHIQILAIKGLQQPQNIQEIEIIQEDTQSDDDIDELKIITMEQNVQESNDSYELRAEWLLKHVPHLRILRSVGMIFNAQDIDAIYKLSPFLEELELEDCEIQAFTSQTNTNYNFSKLHSLILNDVSIRWEDLMTLLSTSPSLTCLQLRECIISGNINQLDPNILKRLTHLKKIELVGEELLDQQRICYFLKYLPALEEIYIRPLNCDLNLNLFTQFKEGELSSLRIINISGSGMIGTYLADMLASTPLLEKISIAGCDITNFTDGLKPGQLQNLKEISLDEITYDKANILAMLKIAPSVRKILLTKGSLEFQPGQLKAGELNVLEEIDFEVMNINVDSLLLLLTAAPNLKKIRLPSCKLIGDLNQLNGKLNKITVLDLSLTKLRSNKLYQLLSSMPSLEELIISDTTSLSDALEKLKPGQLDKLLRITFNNESSRSRYIQLSAKALRCLLAAAPRLMDIYEFQDRYLEKKILDQLEPHEIQRLKKMGVVLNSFSPDQGSEDKPLSEPFQEFSAQSEPKPALETLGAQSIPRFRRPGTTLDKSFFDTKSTNPELKFRRFFPEIHPSRYRLRTWQPKLNTLEGEGLFAPNDFIPCISEQLKQTEINYTKIPAYVCHQAMRAVSEDEGENIILPSLDAEEHLFDLVILDNMGQRIPLEQIQLNYSSSTNFFSVTLPKPGNYSIHYKVAVPAPGMLAQRPPLPKNIDDLLRKYTQDFKETQESPNRDFSSLEDFAKYIQKEQVGTCLHRSIAAYDELQGDELKKCYEELRIVQNDVHAFLELRINGRWYPLDLGGYRAREAMIPMQIHEPPSVAKKQKIFEPLSREPFSLREHPLEEMLAGIGDEENALSLILIPNNETTYKIYSELCKRYTSESIYIAHEPEALNASGFGMTQAGKVKENYADFSRWLKEHEDKPGIIAVDIRKFKSDELAQLNELFDNMLEKPRKFPPKLRIMLIDNPQNCSFYGPDFRRRVKQLAHIQDSAPSDLLPEFKQIQRKVEDKEAKETIEIDLFNSPHWYRKLIGGWQLIPEENEGDFSFQWKEGVLQAMLRSGKSIIFKNPPLFDSRFIDFIAELKSLRLLHWADQSMTVPQDLNFYQTQGYNWQALTKIASIHNQVSTEPRPTLVLSDANLQSFIEDPAYSYSPMTGLLKSSLSHLSQCQTHGIPLAVVCSPELSSETLAQFLTRAKELDVQIHFFVPASYQLPPSSPLALLNRAELKEEGELRPNWISQMIGFELSEDCYFSARQALINNPGSLCFDLSYLEASDLGFFPIVDKSVKNELMKNGKLSMKAELSAIARMLLDGKTVILQGKIPRHLYEALTTLALGYIGQKPFKGRLIVIAPPEDASVVSAIMGEVPPIQSVPMANKIDLLKSCGFEFELKEDIRERKEMNFSALEREALKNELAKRRPSLISEETQKQSFDEKAKAFDANRLHTVEQALTLNPWVMLEGSTGIGKTHFLEEVIETSQNENIVWHLEEWLERKPEQDKYLTLIIDEASFASELSSEGENFLERFNGLRGNPPGFLWKGKYYELTPQHKVIFAFNPASYGAGRRTSGFLNEQALKVSFERLPDYYIYARVIAPLLQKMLPHEFRLNPKWLTDPLINVYRWISAHSIEESLITPREIKAMINLIASFLNMKKEAINSGESIDMQEADIEVLAGEVAYLVGRQALLGSNLLELFESSAFKPRRSILDRQRVPDHYPEHQHEAYRRFQHFFEMRDLIKKTDISDLGLGGLILEGPSGVGKSYFVEQFIKEYQEKNPGAEIIRIPATTAYHEKERLLLEAFERGAIVLAEEFNTSAWPNKLLNKLLMGKGKYGKPASVPGFMLLATQNPPFLKGRAEGDPAILRRMFKIDANWPVYDKLEKLEKAEKSEKSEKSEKTEQKSEEVQMEDISEQPVVDENELWLQTVLAEDIMLAQDEQQRFSARKRSASPLGQESLFAHRDESSSSSSSSSGDRKRQSDDDKPDNNERHQDKKQQKDKPFEKHQSTQFRGRRNE